MKRKSTHIGINQNPMTIDDYQTLTKKVVDLLALYLRQSTSGDGVTLHQEPYLSLASQLSLTELIRSGGLNGDRAIEWVSSYLEHSQHMHHPHYMGHQVAIPHLSAGIADLIHGTINNPMAIYEMGPSAATIEHVVVNWMLSKIGWHDAPDLAMPPASAGGILTHGGSMANLTALLAARAAISPEAWQSGNPADLCVMGSDVAHYSIMRAISIMGLGAKALQTVKTDDREVLVVDDLYRAYRLAIDRGKTVMAVVANACATSTGLYDPVAEIGYFCREYDLWYHIDGAHGASALASSSTRHYMQGCELADSIIWDTHKMLQTSTLCAAVLFRDRRHMASAFDQKGSYLFHDKEQVGIDTMAYTIECTKSGLGTKLFWALAADGEEAMSDFVGGRYQLAHDFQELLAQQDDFEIFYKPEANILCFRYLPASTSNAAQLALRNKIVQRGKYYITSTEVAGRRYLRTVLINPHTTLDHLRGLIDEIRTSFSEM